MRPVTVSAKIAAGPAEILSFISDTRNDSLWCSNVENAMLLTDGPISVGSKFSYTQHLDRPGADRVTFDGDVEIIALDDRSITWNVTDRFQEREILMTVEPQGSGSRVTQTTKATFKRSPGVARYLYPILAKRTLKDQLRGLSDHFENA